MNIKNLKKSAIAFIVLVAMGSAGFDSAYGYGGGSRVKKVEICHNGNTIKVSERSVQSHLNHGDTSGECDDALVQVTTPSPLVFGGTAVQVNSYTNYSPILLNMGTILLSIKTASDTGNISEEDATQLTNQLASVIAALKALFQ